MRPRKAASMAPIAAASALALLLAGGAASAQPAADESASAPTGPMVDRDSASAAEQPRSSADVSPQAQASEEAATDTAAFGPQASEGPQPAEPPQTAEAPTPAEPPQTAQSPQAEAPPQTAEAPQSGFEAPVPPGPEQQAMAPSAADAQYQAQGQGSGGPMSEDPMQTGLPDEQQAQLMMGQAVLDRQGEQVGTVTQIVRDPNTQQLSAAILPEGHSFAESDADQIEVVASLDQLQQGAEGLHLDQELSSLPPFESEQFEVVVSLQEPEHGLQGAQREPPPGQASADPSQVDTYAQPPEDVTEPQSPAG